MDKKVRDIEDSIMKNAMDVFMQYALSFFGIEKKALSVARTEMKDIQVTGLHMDYTFLLEDDSLVHFEFQTTRSRKDLYRFHLYDAMLAYKEMKKVSTVVVYSAGIEEADDYIDMGMYTYRVKTVYMAKMDGDDTYRQLKEKLDSGEVLTRYDMVRMVFIPLMQTVKDREAAIMVTVNLSLEILDRDERICCQSLLYAFAGKFGNDEFKKRLKEVFAMTELGRMIWEDGKVEGVIEGEIQAKLKVAREALKEGLGDAVVAKITGLEIEEIRKLREELEH